MGVSPSGYYDWRQRGSNAHQQYDDVLVTQILQMHKGHRRNYGAGRVHKYLRERDYICSRRRINRLMKQHGIRATYNGGKYAVKAKDIGEVATNRLAEALPATGSGEQWAGDMTYLKTSQGPLYMATVIDLFSRKVIGWGFSRSHDTSLIKGALDLALSTAEPKEKCLFHSDQGSEYRSGLYLDTLKESGLEVSMSRAGSRQIMLMWNRFLEH